ncbi:MAG: 3'-5' exonuclease [Candidatus Dojkabacteria bacterium]|nr:MAG: 3'-5' exonuclease [Candidatus Dojkabacteria bacterium]
MQKYKKYLNPIVTKLDTISDFSNAEITSETQKEEQPYLEKVVKMLISDIHRELKVMEDLEEQIEHWITVIDNETGDDKNEALTEYKKLQDMMHDLLERMNRILDMIYSPYFGKISFHRKKNERYPETTLQMYLGKFAYMDKDSHLPLITDWRAPIANLYYMNTGPTDDVSFVAPTGVQSGDLLQKRQFEIAEGRITHIYDAKSGNAAADEFLLSQLTKRIGQKLKDIVATIQEQQNDIIRAGIDKPTLIQGVAGSGKTTIILHRMAYLFYTYAEKIRPERSLIIAPNRMFLDYISDVLPSLGVSYLEQNVYLFWARSILGFNDKYMQNVDKDNLEIMKLKGSKDFVELINRYFEKLEADIFEGLTGTTGYDIEYRYRELSQQHPQMTMIEKLELSVDYAFAQVQFKKKMIGDFMGNLEVQKEKRKKILDYIRKSTDIYKAYQGLFKRSEITVSTDSISWKEVAAHTNAYLKGTPGNSIGYKLEDLAPMVWLYFKIHGFKDSQRSYIIVDEAQDLSPFQLLTLARIAERGNITIAGDLAQSIVPPFHIDDWDKVIALFKEQIPEFAQPDYFQLFRCYRTTVEVIDYANRIFKKYFPDSYKLPEAVLRHGDTVKQIETSSPLEAGKESDIKELLQILNGETEKGAATTAIICKNEGHADRIHNALLPHAEKMKSLLVSHKEEDYHTGVLVLPIEKAKGLEFDSVILADVSNEHYKDNGLDVRLLYVGITRALHRLYIIHPQGDTSELLSD